MKAATIFIIILVSVLGFIIQPAKAGDLTLPLPGDNPGINSWVDHDGEFSCAFSGSSTYPCDGTFIKYDGTTIIDGSASLALCVLGSNCYEGHNRIDYQASTDTDVISAAEGVIQSTGYSSIAGNWTRVWHSGPGYSTYYAHLNSYIKTGGSVNRGEHIAESGCTGSGCGGAHLHFGVYDAEQGGSPIDPFGWSGQGSDPLTLDRGYLWTSNPPSHLANRPPSVPNLLTPTNNSLLGSQTVNFTWDGSIDPDNDSPLDYSIVVHNNTTGQLALETAWMESTYSYGFTVPSDDYYRWYVKVRDRKGGETQSETRYIQVQSRYRAEIVSKSSDVSFGRGQSAQFEVRLRNTGTVTWERDHPSYPVRLGTSHDRNRTPALYRHDAVGGNPSGWLSENRVTMVESSVSPGNIGTFRFWYSVPSWSNPGTLQEHFELVADNAHMGWFETPDISWNVTILPDWDATYLSQTFACDQTRSLSKGGSLEYTVWLRNTGAQTWTKTGANPVRLGTSGPHDRITTLIREDYLNNSPSGWATDNRVEMVESSVPTGGTGTFHFWLSMPTWHPNAYRVEPFQLVVENIAWIGPEISWCQNLYGQPGDYHAQFISQNSYPTLSIGQSYNFQMTFRNTGTATWHPMVAHLGTSNPLDRTPGFTQGTGWFSSNRAALPVTSVPPGTDATFNFQMTVPSGKSIGDYQEFFRMVADPITWMEDQGTHWWVFVR